MRGFFDFKFLVVSGGVYTLLTGKSLDNWQSELPELTFDTKDYLNLFRPSNGHTR